LMWESFGFWGLLPDALSSLEPEQRNKIGARMRELQAKTREFIEEAIAQGRVEPIDADLAVAFIMGAANNISTWYPRDDHPAPHTVAAAFGRLVLTCVGASPS